jgi:hypothetical protein
MLILFNISARCLTKPDEQSCDKQDRWGEASQAPEESRGEPAHLAVVNRCKCGVKADPGGFVRQAKHIQVSDRLKRF